MNASERAIGEALARYPAIAPAIFEAFADELAERADLRRAWLVAGVAARIVGLHAARTAREVLCGTDEAAKRAVARALHKGASMEMASLSRGGPGPGVELVEGVAVAVLRMREFERDASTPPPERPRLRDAIREPLPDMEDN